MNFTNYRVANRLYIGFGVIILFLVIVGVLGINAVQNSNAALHQIVDINVKKIELVEDLKTSADTIGRVMRTVALVKDDAEKDKQRVIINEARNEYNAALEKLQAMPIIDEGKAILARAAEQRDLARKANDEFMNLVKTDNDAGVKMLLSTNIPINAKWQDALEDFVGLQKKRNIETETRAFDANQSAITLILMFSVVALLVSLGLSWLIARSIRRQLGGEPSEATEVAMLIAGGDLTAAIDIPDTDQTSMMFAIKSMRDNLTKIVGDVRAGTDTIALASGEISTGNLDLSSRTEQQAASLEETASSMEQLTATVKQNADNSRQANKLATTASEVAARGGAVVAQVVSTMDSINESAKKIVDIIGVIDGIAFQTNILALNAAVEAARAGEQGRGFAVVASEVRNLAQRSASAAKEIKGLIGDSVEKVDAGSKLVNEAGATMDEVVDSVKRVNDIITEITMASGEQASGIDQINQAITQMDEVTQQNAALVEQAAAAAGALQEQADMLVDVVRIFKTGHTVSAKTRKPNLAPVAGKVREQRAIVAKPARSAERPRIAVKATQQVASSGSDGWEEF